MIVALFISALARRAAREKSDSIQSPAATTAIDREIAVNKKLDFLLLWKKNVTFGMEYGQKIQK
jgi:hypothetical protein